MKASEAHAFPALLSATKSNTSALLQSGSVTPESSRPPSLGLCSSSEEEPLSIVASRLLTQDSSIRRIQGESSPASSVIKDEDTHTWFSSANSAKIVKRVHSQIDPQVVGDLAQHKPQPTRTLLYQAREEALSPVLNQSSENGLRIAYPPPSMENGLSNSNPLPSMENEPSIANPLPSIHSIEMISQHNLPSPNSLQVPSIKYDQPSAPQKQVYSDSSSNRCVAELRVPDQVSAMNVKRGMKEVEALRAKVKELQRERDETRRRSEEEQNKTEMLAVSCEPKFCKNMR